MKKNVSRFVIDYFVKHPRQDLSREEIIIGINKLANFTFNPLTIDRAISAITEKNKLGDRHPNIIRLDNGKFKYAPKNPSSLDEFME